MPELPDVEIQKQYVDSTALNSKISEVTFPDKSLIQSSAKEFEKALNGKKLTRTKRLGKYLFIECSGGHWLALHFGMTGKLEYYKNQNLPDYTKMLISFGNAYKLAYICPRKFGKIHLIESLEEFHEAKNLGKDALDFSESEFMEVFENKKSSIKAALTDQKSIAGIGNIYADEILYQSKIHPKTKAGELSAKDLKKLYRKINHVLEMAIKKSADPSQLPNGYLITHRKDGADCPRCKGKVKQIKISGRSTYLCEECQKDRKGGI